MSKKKQHRAWLLAARIGPLVAMMAMIFCLILELDTLLEYILYGVAILFAIIAFSWWFWIMDVAKGIMQILESATARFEEIQIQIQQIKKDINDRKDDRR